MAERSIVHGNTGPSARLIWTGANPRQAHATAYNNVMAAKKRPLVNSDAITLSILVIRGHRVLIDSDLAALYSEKRARRSR